MLGFEGKAFEGQRDVAVLELQPTVRSRVWVCALLLLCEFCMNIVMPHKCECMVYHVPMCACWPYHSRAISVQMFSAFLHSDEDGYPFASRFMHNLLTPPHTHTHTDTDTHATPISAACPGARPVGGDWPTINGRDGSQKYARAPWRHSDSEGVLGDARTDHLLHYEVFSDTIETEGE